MKSLKTIALILFITSNTVFAAGYHTCEGKVIDLVSRATTSGTQVKISSMNGWASLKFGDASMQEIRERQFSMLLAAQLAGKTVILEFLDGGMSCSDPHTGVPIRYVRIKTQ